MSNIEIVRAILKYIGRDSVEVDRTLAEGCRILLAEAEKEVQTEPDLTETEQTEKNQPAKISAENFQGRVKQRRGGRPPFDTGKMRALLKAGWSIPKIADEMQVTEQTIRKHCREEGLLKNEQQTDGI